MSCIRGANLREHAFSEVIGCQLTAVSMERCPREKSSSVLYPARAVTYGTHEGVAEGYKVLGTLGAATSGRAVMLRSL
jgi:hypothetical protein